MFVTAKILARSTLNQAKFARIPRNFSTSTAGERPTSSIMGRLSSLLAGMAIGFGINMTMIYDELVTSNKSTDQRLKDIESKISNLESKM